MSSDPSQQQSHNSSLHYHRCWWAFCRHSFYSIVELREHINLEHVQNARPERLWDVPAHKLVEDDYWDSLDFSSPPQVLVVPCPVSNQGVPCEPTPLDYMYSSLPSPPASTPNPSSPASTPHQTPSTPPARVEPADAPPNLNTPPDLSLKSPALVNGFLSSPSRRDFRVLTPTFSSLQSQPNSPSGCNVCIPDSPPFGRLVEEATSVAKSARSASSREEMSSGGCSSQDSVFNQLMKTVSDEENDVERIDSTKESEECTTADSFPLHSLVTDCPKTHTNQRSPTSSYFSPLSGASLSPTVSYSHFVHPDALSYPSSLAHPIAIGTPTARQFWYHGFRRQSHRRTLVPDSGLASQSLRLGLDTFTASLASRSDVSRPSTPVLSVVSPVSQSSPPSNQPQLERSRMQTDSQLTTSYPPLLTQAPYHSQDMTQSQD